MGAALAVLGLHTGSAYGEDNTSQSFVGVTTNLGGALIVGNTGTNNTLLISSGSVVTNTEGIIGNGSTAKFNSALVTGPGTVWVNTGTNGQLVFQAAVMVGSDGSFNSLVISNGAKVFSSFAGALGGNYPSGSSGSNNTAVVTGAGSVWSNATRLAVGLVSANNRLTISDGGKVYANEDIYVGEEANTRSNLVVVTGSGSLLQDATFRTLYVGWGGNSDGNQMVISNGARVIGYNGTVGNSGKGNEVVVTGAGSAWTNNGVFTVGVAGTGNRVIVTNGGLVHAESPSSGESYIGQNAGSSNNFVSVGGSGSALTVSYSLFVGNSGASNALHITDGAVALFKGLNLSTSNGLVVGRSAGSDNNLVTVTGGTIISTNATSRNIIDVRRGALVFNSGSITTDNLRLTNGASSVFTFNGGTLKTKSTIVSNTTAFVVGNGSSSATLQLLGGTHSFANGLTIHNNATLTGTGTVQGDTTVQGTLAPGNSPGIINFGNLTLASNSTFTAELNGTVAGTGYDQANVAGSVTISNANLSLSLGFSPTTGNQFTIINNDLADAVSGTFLGLAEGSSVFVGTINEFQISYVGGTGNDVVLTFLVPEPTSLTLLALGGLLLWRRRHSG